MIKEVLIKSRFGGIFFRTPVLFSALQNQSHARWEKVQNLVVPQRRKSKAGKLQVEGTKLAPHWTFLRIEGMHD